MTANPILLGSNALLRYNKVLFEQCKMVTHHTVPSYTVSLMSAEPLGLAKVLASSAVFETPAPPPA